MVFSSGHRVLVTPPSLFTLFFFPSIGDLQEWLGGFREGGGGDKQEGEFVDSFDRVS